jgi:hypothetical protein
MNSENSRLEKLLEEQMQIENRIKQIQVKRILKSANLWQKR